MSHIRGASRVSPQVRDRVTVSAIMADVMVALIPVLAMATYFFGLRVLVLTGISIASCVGFEALYCRMVGKPVCVRDLSACVTGLMLALTLPVTAPYWAPVLGGLFAILGHNWPVFYGFKGGKGVVCLASLLLMLDWRIFCILLVMFVASVACTKYISFGSVLCSMLFPLILNRMNNTGLSLIEFVALAIAVIVVIKHVPNIKRIFQGTESKFEIKKSKKAED